MNRTLTFMVTGLCAAPLLALAGMALTVLLAGGAGGGSDRTIALGINGLLGGSALAVAGFFVLGYGALRFVAPQHLRYLFAVDVILLVGGVAAWWQLLAPAPVLEYEGGSPVLQIELRIAQTVLAGERIDALAAIDFVGGPHLSMPHPELARADGDAMILPWETTPVRVGAWEVAVFMRGDQLLFELALPRQPAGAADWSGWIAPAARAGFARPQGVTLRYRFLVRPHGT